MIEALDSRFIFFFKSLELIGRIQNQSWIVRIESNIMIVMNFHLCSMSFIPILLSVRKQYMCNKETSKNDWYIEHGIVSLFLSEVLLLFTILIITVSNYFRPSDKASWFSSWPHPWESATWSPFYLGVYRSIGWND